MISTGRKTSIPSYHNQAGRKQPLYSPPSWLAEATELSTPGTLSRHVIESAWPSNAATNGCANIRSSLLAFNARFRSRARACGCCSGSRFREIWAGAPEVPGRCEAASCARREIFYEDNRQNCFREANIGYTIS